MKPLALAALLLSLAGCGAPRPYTAADYTLSPQQIAASEAYAKVVADKLAAQAPQHWWHGLPVPATGPDSVTRLLEKQRREADAVEFAGLTQLDVAECQQTALMASGDIYRQIDVKHACYRARRLRHTATASAAPAPPRPRSAAPVAASSTEWVEVPRPWEAPR